MLYLLYADTGIVNDGVKFRAFFSEMSEERRKRVNLCAFNADRKRSLTVGILMDAFLKTKGFREKNVNYSVSETGRLYFSDDNPEEIRKLFFSISHSGNISTVVFSDHPVGIDIEEINAGYTYIRIANRYFPEREKKLLLEQKSEDESKKLFFKLYTEKESYYKCFFDRDISNYVELDIEEKQKEEGFFLYHPRLPGDYAVTICSPEEEIITEKMIF